MRSPTVEWQVAGACNYDCSYCIQKKATRKGRPDAERVAAAIAFFATMPGVWEIKCSGGEAFAHALFLDAIVPGLIHNTPHILSVLTNLSASEADLERFVSLTRGRLSVFSASLHLEHVEPAAFVAKARRLVDQLDPTVRFVINQVVLPGREAEALACRALAEAAGLRWFPQLYKVDGGVAFYPDEGALRAVIGDAPGPREANLAPSYRGRRCWTGVDYFTVDKDGTAWSCRTAKRHKTGRLGNLYDGTVRLLDAPRACPWEICPCTVPANRGMIEGVSA